MAMRAIETERMASVRDSAIIRQADIFIGDVDDCLAEGKMAAEGCEDPADARDAEELAGMVTYASVV